MKESLDDNTKKPNTKFFESFIGSPGAFEGDTLRPIRQVDERTRETAIEISETLQQRVEEIVKEQQETEE